MCVCVYMRCRLIGILFPINIQKFFSKTSENLLIIGCRVQTVRFSSCHIRPAEIWTAGDPNRLTTEIFSRCWKCCSLFCMYSCFENLGEIENCLWIFTLSSSKTRLPLFDIFREFLVRKGLFWGSPEMNHNS